MNSCTLILALAACLASSYGKPSGFLPAPLVAPVAPLAYSAPIVTSRSSQVFHRNFNALAAAPLVAAPVAAPVFARYAYAAPAVAAPVAAPVVAPAKYVAPAVAAPAPLVAAPAAVAAPAVAAPVAPASFAYYI